MQNKNDEKAFLTIRLHFTLKYSFQVKPQLVILLLTEAVARRFYVKQVFLKISQYSQEHTCDADSFLIKLQAEGVQLY